jgi:hypothetical protein
MREAIIWIGGFIVIALVFVGTLLYFKKIGRGDADPVVDPSWPTIMRPSSPHQLRGEDE